MLICKHHPFWETGLELPWAQLLPPALDSAALAPLVLTVTRAGWRLLPGRGSVCCVCITLAWRGTWPVVSEE